MFTSRWDKVCVNCRRRRVKCDGVRPQCGQCSRSLSYSDCEYADEGRATGTQILEEQIARTEARIEALERPGHSGAGGLGLQDPYTGKMHSHGSSSIQRTQSTSGSLYRAPTPSRHQTSGSTVSRRVCLNSFWPTNISQEMSLDKLEPLIHNFLQHSSQFGFFLNVHRFQKAIRGSSSHRAAPVLLDAVCLWAVHLSDSSNLSAYEANYLSQALRSAVNALSGTHSSNTILDAIQAEVLLTYYFLRNTRFIEAKYHLSAAVSLVISSGLHRIRSGDVGNLSGSRSMTPPRDTIEEWERVNAFWTVLTLNNCWTAADGSPSNISYTDTNSDARIDTPWPSDINASGLQNQALPISSFGTITAFLNNQQDSGVTLSALHAKAAILFEQASRLASQYQPNMRDRRQFYASFKAVDALIESFKLNLPTVQSHPTREMIVIHSLAQVATIQLHNPFVADADASDGSRSRVVTSARAIVANLTHAPLQQFRYVDPIMGTLLMTVCRVFVSELARFRRYQQSNGSIPPQERLVMDTMDTALSAMNILAANCPLMNSQLVTIQQSYRGH
ncbi:fungal-trans domain-containing protein [Favolaschia claudopus]|uniref:Fungal-trans domain-containing protein n=1 Tax=Favolaschia claudopus TaxID=2862362 RepID=A0AAW0DBU1_9AGAR